MEITVKKFGTFFTLNVYCEFPPDFTEEQENVILDKLEDETFRDILSAKVNGLLDNELEEDIYVITVELV
jgi:hypothetical protein